MLLPAVSKVPLDLWALWDLPEPQVPQELPGPLAQQGQPGLLVLWEPWALPELLDLLDQLVQLDLPVLRGPLDLADLPERFIKESQLSVKMRFLVKPPRYGY